MRRKDETRVFPPTQQAVGAGAVACTTNPTYAWKQLQHPETKAEVVAMIQEAIKETHDDHEAADLVQQRCVSRILPTFSEIHAESKGKLGFVSIQGNPFEDNNGESIAEEARRYRTLGSNVIAKVPVTKAGLEAIDALVREDVPVIATEVMSIAQALVCLEVYADATEESGYRPPFFLTHITGIFDQYLKRAVEEAKIDVSPDMVSQAGTILARRQYRMIKEKGFDGIVMLGGGARGPHHFTEMVGGEMHVTINWQPTAKEIITADPAIVYRIETPSPQFMVDELMSKVSDFRKAYEADGLSVEEFEDFGPVRLFRSMFCDGWTSLVGEIKKHRDAA